MRRYEFKREPLTAEERDRLCNACETQQEKLIIWTMLDTGLRVSEFCSLKPDMVQWSMMRINMLGKGKKKRVVPMSLRVKRLLEYHFTERNEIGWGDSWCQKIIHKVANRARLDKPVSPHVLRHTFATHSLQDGVSLVAVQKALGHSDLQTTAIYLNMSNEEACREFLEKRK